MTLHRLALMLMLSAAPAAATTSPAVLEGCTPEAQQGRYNQGYVDGVEAIKAQLAKATLQMQDQVQRQLNDQLAQIAKARDADLTTQMRDAQAQALKEAAAAPMPRALRGGATARAPSAGAGLPSDPADLAPGSVLTIRNAETLPPDLYAGLLAYLQR